MVKQLKRTLRFVLQHPLNQNQKRKALIRFLRWQLGIRLLGSSAVVPFTNDSRLIVKKGMSGATGNVYTGLYDYEDMSFLCHYLRPEDCFIDIGANVGVYTVLAASSRVSKIIAIEPIPQTFAYLLDNIRLNNATETVIALNCGVGKSASTQTFTVGLDATNHVVVDKNKTNGNTIQVSIQSLDQICKDCSPSVIKMDVEGFEGTVLEGGTKTLENENLNIILIELTGASENYGHSSQDINNTLVKAGFSPYSYHPKERKLIEGGGVNSNKNVLYIRRIDEARKRIREAKPLQVFGTIL